MISFIMAHQLLVGALMGDLMALAIAINPALEANSVLQAVWNGVKAILGLSKPQA